MAKAAIAGVQALGGNVTDSGILTTPQCHYIVRSLNSPYGEPTESGYYSKFSKAYIDLVGPFLKNSAPTKLVLDAANGVGAEKMRRLAEAIGTKYLNVTVINDGNAPGAVLNHKCGSDHVKVTQSAPLNVTPDASVRFASVDGDADRLVCFYFDAGNKFHLLDGDKIAGLCARFLGGLAKAAGLTLKIGIVQTAYANGSSTQYLSQKLVRRFPR